MPSAKLITFVAFFTYGFSAFAPNQWVFCGQRLAELVGTEKHSELILVRQLANKLFASFHQCDALRFKTVRSLSSGSDLLGTRGPYFSDVSLVVEPGDDIAQISRLLAQGGDEAGLEGKIRARLKEGRAEISLVELMPKFARERINTHPPKPSLPFQEIREGLRSGHPSEEVLAAYKEWQNRANCMNGACNYHDSDVGVGFTSMDKFRRSLNRYYTQLKEGTKLKPGDTIVLWETNINADGYLGSKNGFIIEHVFIYLGGDLTFHYPNLDGRPYEICPLDEALRGGVSSMRDDKNNLRSLDYFQTRNQIEVWRYNGVPHF